MKNTRDPYIAKRSRIKKVTPKESLEDFDHSGQGFSKLFDRKNKE